MVDIQSSVPEHIQKILMSEPMRYFTDLEKEAQEKYLDFAIKFVEKRLKAKKCLQIANNHVIREEMLEEEQDFLNSLIDLNIDFIFENRYGISQRIAKAVNDETKRLMQDIQDNFMDCEFLTEDELLHGEPENDRSKYGNGLARFASIILSREKLKAKQHGDANKLQIIKICKETLKSKMKTLNETFAHEDRELEKMLLNKLNEDAQYLNLLNEICIEKGTPALFISKEIEASQDSENTSPSVTKSVQQGTSNTRRINELEFEA